MYCTVLYSIFSLFLYCAYIPWTVVFFSIVTATLLLYKSEFAKYDYGFRTVWMDYRLKTVFSEKTVFGKDRQNGLKIFILYSIFFCRTTLLLFNRKEADIPSESTFQQWGIPVDSPLLQIVHCLSEAESHWTGRKGLLIYLQ